MSSDLVHVPRTDRAGATTRIERLDPPTPGSYWRLRADFQGRNDDRTRARSMKAGTVLMLAAIEQADGVDHLYRFSPHPLDERHSSDAEFHAEDLFVFWEPAPDGEAVRLGEMEALMLGMDATRAKLMQPPPDAVPVALIPHDPSADIGVDGRALVTSEQVAAMLQRAEMIKADAEARSKWIEKHTGTLATQGKQLARFHQERAQAVLARAQSKLESVKGVLKTVANLRLYTGEGVELWQLRDGAAASPDARVTVYQDVLALDEETLVLLERGGLDHTQVDSLIEALADPELVNRLIPSERGVVLCRFRNTYKEFMKARGVEGAAQVAHYNARMSELSRANRLLVRDGERLYLVSADSVLESIKQLMPSAAEQSAYFRKERWGEAPKEITPEDLDYARAQRQQMHALDAYGQVLIMLWGLRDCDSIFADSHLPRFGNWLEEGFQRAWLDLVSHDSLLGMSRPDYREWSAKQNGYLAAGCWVAVDLAQAYDSERAPGGFSRGRSGHGEAYYNRVYSPEAGRDAVLIERVRTDKEGLYVEVPCRYDGFNHDCDRSARSIKLYVAFHVPRERDRYADGFLVLDRVHAADLTYYLESRQQRRAYLKYVALFNAARTWVAARDKQEAPLREQLRQAVAAAGIAVDPAELERRLSEALAVARAARRDRSIPSAGTASFRTYLEAVLNILHAGVSDNGQRVAAVQAWADRTGRQPLRLVLTPKAGWKLYLVPSAAEHDARLGPPMHATVAKVEFTDSGATVHVEGRELLRARSGEQVIHDWEWQVEREEMPNVHFSADHRMRDAGAKHWLGLDTGLTLSYEDSIAALNLAAGKATAFERVEDLLELVHAAKRYALDVSRREVVRMPLTVVVGTVLGRPISPSGRREPALLVASCDALVYAFHHGDEAVKAAARQAVRSIYRHKDSNEAALVNSTFKWSAGLVALGDHRKLQGLYCHMEPHGRACPDFFKPERKTPPRLEVTTLNPAGARLLPWLVEHAKAPTA